MCPYYDKFMKAWIISTTLLLGIHFSTHAADQNIRVFRAVDPVALEKKVPAGSGHVFVDAARTYRLDPLVLAAISAHETGRWKSVAARKKNNWMGLMTSRGAKRFSKAEDSIYYAAQLLNRRPFRGRNMLSQIAVLYCAADPTYWKASILQWERLLGR